VGSWTAGTRCPTATRQPTGGAGAPGAGTGGTSGVCGSGSIARVATQARPRPVPPARRSVLAAGAVWLLGGSAVLSGCTRSGTADGRSAPSPATATPTPRGLDEEVVARATATTGHLLDVVTRDGGSAGTSRTPASPVTAGHRAHLAALAALDLRPPAGGPTAGGPTAAPRGRPAGPEGLVAAHRDAVEEALEDLLGASPPVAVLLARIAAARACHADLIAAAQDLPVPGPPPATGPLAGATAPPPSEWAALGTLLDGEHAAVFGYGVVTGRVAPSRREQARREWQAHLARRDELRAELLGSGRTPPAAAAAYDVGRPPQDSAAAIRLAVALEVGLARVAASAVAACTGPRRALAARALVTAARTATRWRGRPEFLPGG